MNVIDVSYPKSSAAAASRDAVPPEPQPASGISTSVSAAEDSSSALPAASRAYPAPAAVPTQEGPRGIRFDFNDGCRIMLPEGAHPWRVRLSDIDTGNILFETELKTGRVNSTKRYFVRMRLQIWANGENVLSHDYLAKDCSAVFRSSAKKLAMRVSALRAR